MTDQNLITKEGLEEMKDELKNRIEIERVKIAEAINEARNQGDLSENAAYKAAMEDKEFNENRIEELERMIASSKVVEKNVKDKVADLGERVVVERHSDGKEREYVLVGENEADPSNYKISIKSPIGQALMQKRVGDTVKVEMPGGEEEFRIVKIK